MFRQLPFPGRASAHRPAVFSDNVAQNQEPPESSRTDPVGQRVGPSCLPHCPSSDQPLAVEGFKVYDDSGLPSSMRPGSACVASTPSPRTPPQANQDVNPWPRGFPVSLHAALPAGQRPNPPEARGGRGRPRGLARARLWASTRKQRMAAKERSTRRSNAFFWSCCRPASRHSTTRHEVVVPTPQDPTVQPEPSRERESWDAVLSLC